MSLRLLFVSLIAMMVATAAAPAAQASPPEKAFAGQVILSDKSFPHTAKSPDAYTAAVKKQSKTKFDENKADGTWHIYFAAFLRAPLDDLEYTVKLFDTSGKQQQLIAAIDQYTDKRGQRSLLSDFTIERKKAGVNKPVTIVVISKGKIMATGKFQILGEADKHSGKVDFTDGDTKSDGSDE